MRHLPLDSLRIQNFRTFKDLTIDRLGRVNLIVGKNNTGKTALLEGVYFWSRPTFWMDYLDLLAKRYPKSDKVPDREVIQQRIEVLRHFFHGRPEENTLLQTGIQVGPTEDPKLNRWVGIYNENRQWSKNPAVTETPFLGVGKGAYQAPEVRSEVVSEPSPPRTPGSAPSLRFGISAKENRQIDSLGPSWKIQYVASNGLHLEDAESLWEEAIRGGIKQKVIRVLRVMVEDAQDLDWIDEPMLEVDFSGSRIRRSVNAESERIPLLKVSSQQKPLPVATFGEGVERTLGMALALVSAQDGILLIDEFENGLHHTVQRDLWEMVFDTARELNVQVFATTHSYDCVRAFQEAAEASPEEGQLISLRRSERPENEGQVVAVPYDEDMLASVAESNIEVR